MVDRSGQQSAGRGMARFALAEGCELGAPPAELGRSDRGFVLLLDQMIELEAQRSERLELRAQRRGREAQDQLGVAAGRAHALGAVGVGAHLSASGSEGRLARVSTRSTSGSAVLASTPSSVNLRAPGSRRFS